jgi:hypothetical protein
MLKKLFNFAIYKNVILKQEFHYFPPWYWIPKGYEIIEKQL